MNGLILWAIILLFIGVICNIGYNVNDKKAIQSGAATSSTWKQAMNVCYGTSGIVFGIAFLYLIKEKITIAKTVMPTNQIIQNRQSRS